MVTTLTAVQFRPPDPGQGAGTVDYRLDRRRLLRAFRAGSIGQDEICDAQPELVRVGRECSLPSRSPCPVCAARTLRTVRFVFGPRLPRGGRAVTSEAELERLAAKAGEHRCYVVEVCTSCRWNHLLSSSVLRARPA